MKTNQIFSLKRFINLIKSDLLINYKRYALMILVMTILGYVVLYLNMPKHTYGMNSVSDFNISKYMNLFMTFIIFSLGAWIGLSFPAFNNKNTRRNYLMSPASTFEKYSAQFLGRVIISTVMFLIIFWFDAQIARFTVLHSVNENIPIIEKFTYSGLIERLRADTFTNWLLPLFTLALFMFLFAVRIYFKKQGLLKTIFSLASVLLLIFFVLVVFTQFFFPEYKMFEIHTYEYKMTEKLLNGEILTIVILIFSAVMLPILGYFKLKEKEL